MPVSRIDVAARVAELVEGLRKGAVVGMAANSARRLIGVGLLRPGRGIREHTGRVEVLLVHPDHARNGLGTSLLTGLLSIAADRAVHRVDLEMQDDDRLAGFFGRFGFQEWGRRPSWLRIGAGEERDEVVLGATVPPAG
jgi:GNAT superfamily N-acetyltransferase